MSPTESPIEIRLSVNGKPVTARVEPRLTLADFLRERLNLTGTHLGCEHGICGACTVLVGEPGTPADAVRGCLMFAVQANGREVTTVEGLSAEGTMNALQQSFQRNHALQCGFCSAGMLVTATALLRDCPHPDAGQVREALSGNLCRCTGYIPIVQAVLDAAHSKE
jgi:aerobic-type carbon monoxide dehydrogenase small subunit (CoxS/CutS family)